MHKGREVENWTTFLELGSSYSGAGFCLLLSSTILYYPLLSSAILYYPLLSSTILYYPLQSSTILYYPLLSSTLLLLLEPSSKPSKRASNKNKQRWLQLRWLKIWPLFSSSQTPIIKLDFFSFYPLLSTTLLLLLEPFSMPRKKALVLKAFHA